jgi:surface-anchored protein
VSAFTINWGTGPPDPFPGGNGANCSASEYGGVFWPSGGGSGTFTSPILPAGTYTVTVTATATGCDGSDPQTAVQKLTVTVP